MHISAFYMILDVEREIHTNILVAGKNPETHDEIAL